MRTRIQENFLLRLEDGTFNVYSEDGEMRLLGNFNTVEEAAEVFFADREERGLT